MHIQFGGVGSMVFRSLLKPWGRALAVIVAAVFFNATVSHQAMAGFVSSPAPVGHNIDRASDLSAVQEALETKIVRQRLADLGYTKEEISNRLNRLSNEELHEVAAQAEILKAGGSDVLVVLLALILIILIIKLLGHDIQIK